MGIFKEFKAGTLDLISSDYTRPESNASEMLNVLFTGSVEDPATEKRFGMKRRAANGPVHGETEFERLRPIDLVRQSELIGFFKDGLRRRKSATLSVSYSGSAVAVSLTLVYRPSTLDFRCTIVADGVTVYDGDLGKGYDESSPVTLSDLSTALNLISGITATVSGTSTIPAALVENLVNHDLKAESYTFTAYEWEAVEQGGGNYPGAGGWYIQAAWLDQPEYEPIYSTSLNNCLYFYYGGVLMKYDGKNYYPSGCEKPDAPSLAATPSGGSIPAGTYQYMARVKHVDNVGNIIYGPWSDVGSVTLGATRDVNITLTATDPTALKATRCSSTMGSAGATISVSANVFTIDDKICVWDRANSEMVYARVINTASGSITIDASVQLTSGDAITLGTSVEIARTHVGGSLFFYALERPIEWLTPAPQYLDSALDSALIEEVIETEFEFGPAPAGKYVTKYQGGLVVSGFPLSRFNRAARAGIYGQSAQMDYGLENDVAFADYENYEGFPLDGSFTVSVESDQGDKVRGIVECGNSLMVLKDRSVARLTGDPTQLNMALDWPSREVGCLAGHTVKEMNGQVMFLSSRGFAILSEATAPNEKSGYVIRPIINNSGKAATSQLQFLCGHTALLNSRQLYVAYFPAYAADSLRPVERITIGPNLGDGQPNYVDVPIPFENGNGRTFVFDYLRNRWAEWYLNAMGGLAEYDGELVMSDRRLYSGAVVSSHWQENIGNIGQMYNDHDQAIRWLWGTAWHHAGKPSIPKHFPRVRISSVPTTTQNDPTLQIRQQVNFIRADFAEVEVDLDIQASPFQVVAQSCLADGKFRAIRLLLENDEHNTNVQIEGWEIETDMPYIEELKT